VTPPVRCWFCSGEIRATDRSRVVADLNVTVHSGCFDQLYESEGPRPWSAGHRPLEPREADDEESDKPS
jgi:hypothetical protein